MITIYDFLEVNEDASKEEIEKSYQKLILKYHKNPSLSEEENNNNEIILNKLKIAYGILIDDEKRKRYDKEISNKRAEELIKNVSTTTNVKTENEHINETPNQQENLKIQQMENETAQANNVSEEDFVNLSKKEKRELRKAAQNEFRKKLKKAQKAEEEYNKAYNEAYNNYLRKMGYTVKEPWTLKRIKRVVIAILVTIIVCYLLWIIPPTKKILIEIYKENFIVKTLVDIVIILFKSIISIFK